MPIEWPTPLVETLARRRCVVVIGSGVSANSVNEGNRRPPTWRQFLEEAHSQLPNKRKHISAALRRYDLLEACEYLREELGQDQWANTIRGSFVEPNYRPAKIHEAIFNLDSRITLSLNFDRIFDDYAAKTSERTFLVKNYYDDEIRQTLVGKDQYLLKPHGGVDTITRMIFTAKDYGLARVKHSGFYEILNALLHTHTFLCIGCGLSDPDMKILFEDYRYKYSECPHYIILPSPVPSAQKKLIQDTRGMNVITYNKKDDHAELTDSLQALADLVNIEQAIVANELTW